jgi:hypothetical protein
VLHIFYRFSALGISLQTLMSSYSLLAMDPAIWFGLSPGLGLLLRAAGRAEEQYGRGYGQRTASGPVCWDIS